MSDINRFPKILFPADFIGDNWQRVVIQIPEQPNLKMPVKTETDKYQGFFIVSLTFGLIYCFKDPYLYLPIWAFITLLVINYYYVAEKRSKAEYEVDLKKATNEYDSEKNKRSQLILLQETINKINKMTISEGKKRRHVLSELVKSKSLIYSDSSFNNKGFTEDYFAGLLNNAFGELLIHRNLEIGGYTPDFIYSDLNFLINIIIEIDEPYSLHEREPIHYIGSDDLRDAFFVNHYFAVVRFTEYQVVKESVKCIETIKDVIQVMKGVELNYNISNTIIKSWTYDEAIHFAENNLREKYLGISLKNRKIIVKKESPKTDDDFPF
jgi:very-short-patch-repair endonuclease